MHLRRSGSRLRGFRTSRHHLPWNCRREHPGSTKDHSRQNLDGSSSTLYEGPVGSTVRFSIGEAFRGIDGQSEITLADSGPCHYPFQRGKQYLVFADTFNGTLQTSLCAGNRSIDNPDKDSDIQWMRAYATSPSGTRLFGTVVMPGGQRAANISVSVAGDASANTTTDSDGRYTITSLPPGKYTASVEPPLGFLSSGTTRPIILEDRGCSQQNFPLECDSHLRGRVTDEDGNPVAKISVQLEPSGASAKDRSVYMRMATTGDDGTYDVDRMRPGEYLVEVNKYAMPGTPYPSRFYGGDAFHGQTVTVTASTDVTGINITLPRPWVEVALPVKVTEADGTPVAKVWIDHVDEAYRNGAQEGISTAPDGTAMLHLFAGHSYHITARLSGGTQTRCSLTVALIPHSGEGMLSLQLAATPGECDNR